MGEETSGSMVGCDSKYLVQNKKKIAVEEEEFTEALTKIIRRDFFPDVAKLGDDTKNLLPDYESAPSSESTVIEGNSKLDIEKLRLNQFLNRYESEDDASFTEMLAKSREAHCKKHAWLYNKEQEYSQLTDEKKLSLAGKGEQAGLDSWTYTAKNSLMYIPDGVECSPTQSLSKTTYTQGIVHVNTRLPHEFVQKYQHSTDYPKRPAQDKVGVDGKFVSPDESPRINGYGFMATPQIVPGVDASPLMTWGSIEGTPLRLDSEPSATPGPSFKMPKIPAREKLALKLADKVAKASRERKKASSVASPFLSRERKLTTPSKFDRLHLLSPAARKFIGQRTKYSDAALGASYSPQLVRLHSGVHTPSNRSKLTPNNSTPSLTDDLLNIHNV